jgi:hypothetical protein
MGNFISMLYALLLKLPVATAILAPTTAVAKINNTVVKSSHWHPHRLDPLYPASTASSAWLVWGPQDQPRVPLKCRPCWGGPAGVQGMVEVKRH